VGAPGDEQTVEDLEESYVFRSSRISSRPVKELVKDRSTRCVGWVGCGVGATVFAAVFAGVRSCTLGYDAPDADVRQHLPSSHHIHFQRRMQIVFVACVSEESGDDGALGA
jgi:hypothetical protein